MFRGPDAVFVVWPNVVELMLIGKPASLFVGPTRNAVWLNRSRNNASRFTYARPAEMRFAMLRSRFHNPGPYRKMRCPSSPGVVGDCRYCGLARPSGPISFGSTYSSVPLGPGRSVTSFCSSSTVMPLRTTPASNWLYVDRPLVRKNGRPDWMRAMPETAHPLATWLRIGFSIANVRLGPNGSSYVQ